MSGTPLSDVEVDYLSSVAEWSAVAKAKRPFTAEDAAKRRAELLEKRETEREIAKRVYAEVLEKMLGLSADVQLIALQRAVDEARDPDTGELDPSKVSTESLNIALKVGKEVADRVVGKATQTITGEIKHDHKHTIWRELADSGELDGESIEDAAWHALPETTE